MEECLSNHAVCRDFRSRKLRFPSPARPAGRAARTSPRGNGAGGGETDLVHDGIVAELKVEKTTTLSKDNVAQFLGQTTSYASGLEAQLRIAVILDLSEKKNPLGHPPMSTGWSRRSTGSMTRIPPKPAHVCAFPSNVQTRIASS
jgi:hypothetical protein